MSKLRKVIAAMRKEEKEQTKICKQCNERFFPEEKNQIYCCESCQEISSRIASKVVQNFKR